MNRRFSMLFALTGLSFACSPPVNNSDTGPSDASNDAAADGSSTTLTGSAFCSSIPAPGSCSMAGAVVACGVCVVPPGDPSTDRLTRTSCASISDDPQYCDMANPAAAPNLGCYTGFDPAHPPTPPTSQTVTLWGVVDVFGTGGDSNNVHIQVYEIAADGSPGTMVGEATTDAMVYHEDDVERDTGGNIVMSRTLAGFSIPNIQTDHPYIIKTIGTTPDYFAHAIYDYSVPIRGTDVGTHALPTATNCPGCTLSITGPHVYARLRTISNSDWMTIPSTATLPTGIPAGHGALAGEVHDCDDVRLANAQVYAAPEPNFTSPIYFSDNPSRPLPDISRASRGTGALGIYALLDMNPGNVRVSAVGYDPNGTLTLAGAYGVRIFADSVTVVSFRGIRPWQYTTP